ncbi:tripartite tricarboxylate transporter TctB family protein [Protaetiibacter larvae]|uniref:Tripartite tricarboxylate transporter TctB family protein n=1 Tax=Protaetiibacter larvae TaxID=2592654 RepID=A0A5C1Y9C0_9MICO|nr:tripartite tricarboxylate transporter TctB family protein [Protaetiibacter larvae]QEO09502.1 tripartite tricarboxylate transporter TctB family protein [Protaetiibacter larvae]
MADVQPTENPADAERRRRGIRRELVIVGVVLVAFSVLIGVMSIQLAARRNFEPDSSGMFPLIVGAGLLLFSILFLVQSIRPRDEGYLEEHMEGEKQRTRMRVVVWVVLVLVAYAALVALIGYTIATAALFVGVSRLLGEKRWFLNVGVGVAMAAAVYFGFTLLLGVRLPAGFLGFI